MKSALDTPDVTSIQKLVAAGLVLLSAIIVLVNAFEWGDITAGEGAAIVGVYVAFGGLLAVADAVIRNGRSRAYLNAPKGVVADSDGANLTSYPKGNSTPGPGA